MTHVPPNTHLPVNDLIDVVSGSNIVRVEREPYPKSSILLADRETDMMSLPAVRHCDCRAVTEDESGSVRRVRQRRSRQVSGYSYPGLGKPEDDSNSRTPSRPLELVERVLNTFLDHTVNPVRDALKPLVGLKPLEALEGPLFRVESEEVILEHVG